MSDDVPTAFTAHLEKVNELHFFEHWKEYEKPFVWLANWERLTLILSLQNTHAGFHVVERKFLTELPDEPYLALYPQREMESIWFGLDEKKQEPEAEAHYRELQEKLLNKNFTRSPSEKGTVIEFKFTTSGKRDLNFIEDGQTDYGCNRKTDGEFTLRSSAEPKGGYLSVVTEKDAEWSNSVIPGTIQITGYLPLPQMKEFMEALKNVSADAEIRAELDVLTFQSEVERSLAEPYHRQTYSFEKSKVSSVVLKSVIITEGRTQARENPANEQPSEARNAMEPNAPGSISPVNVSLMPRSGIVALWLIAIALLFHLFK